MYFLCSENTSNDQLHVYHAADLRHAKSRFSHDLANYHYINMGS